MTLTGTFVLAFTPHGDTLQALTRAARLGTAALGLLFRYLTCPPQPGVVRADMAAGYGVSISALRRDNDLLAEAGYLMQARRPIGRGRWQHLIVATDTPGRLPAEHEAWVLLDASLAAEQANTSGNPAHVATCDDTENQQAATCAEIPHIEPVNPFPPADDHNKPSVVATLADLKRLALLPPLKAPTDQGNLWLTPSAVVGLAAHYPPRYADLALGVLAKCGLPFYLAPSVMALMLTGYSTDQLTRTLEGVHEGDHPAALARYRLDQLILTPAPETVAWRAPSTTIPISRPPAPAEQDAAYSRGAAKARENLRRASMRA
ncbi:MAG TPA: hypothetical protein VFF37_06635 [Streptomyces sp.]|nr:hypothetical protein [Streptomyces sp.]